MNKKEKLIIIGALALIASIISIVVISTSGAGIEFYSVGSHFELSFINHLIECDTLDKLEAFVQPRNAWVQVSHYQLSDINPRINSLVIRNTGEEITKWRNNVYLNCDFPTTNLESVKVDGSVLFITSAPLPSGADSIVKSVKVNFNEKTLKRNSDRLIASYVFESKDIESFLKTNKNDNAWIKVLMTPDFNFKVTFTKTEQKQESRIGCNPGASLCEFSLFTNYLVKKVTEQEPTASLGTEVRLDSHSPKIFQKPLASHQKFISVIGSADFYQENEGKPYIQLIQPNGVKSTKFTMNQQPNTSGDKWTAFKISVALPPDPSVGTWQIRMDSPAVQRGQSLRTFEVLAESDKSPTSEGDEIPPIIDAMDETGGITNSAIVGKAFIKYKVLYNGGEVENNIADEPGFDFGLSPLQLTNEIDSRSSDAFQLQNIRLETLLKFDGAFDKNFSVLSDDLKYKGTVTIGGKSSDLTSLDLQQITIGTKNDFGILLDVVEITESEIQTQIVATGVEVIPGQRERVNLKVTIDGSFTLRGGDGTRYTGIIQDAVFEYETFYSKKSTDPQPQPVAKQQSDCVDFFGIPVLCSSSDSTSDDTVTTNDKDTLGSPDDKAGTDIGDFGFCDTSIIQCANALVDQISASKQQESNDLLLIALVIVVAVVLLAVVVKKRPQTFQRR